MSYPMIEIGELMLKRNGSVDPSKFVDETFELHSIPAFDRGFPDIVKGSEIGSSKQLVQENDVMISKIVPHIRRASVVCKKGNFRQIASGEWIVFRSNKIYPDYLKHVLISDNFNKQFMATVSGVGGSLLRARPAFVSKIKIALPPLEEQRRIASILDQADELRQKRQQAIEKLDQLLQAIFIDMFGDPASNPKNFETIKFSKIGKWKSGATPSKANENFWIGDFPWVSPKDMKVDHLFDAQDHISDLAFKETNLKKIAKGHLLIVVRGMILAHSFPTAINEVDVSINQDMKAIEPIDQVNIVYLKCAIDAFKPFILELISDAAHGTKRFDLVYAELINIPIPPLSLQLKFQTIYQKIKFERLKYEKQLLECDSLFKSLQNQAFSGNL